MPTTLLTGFSPLELQDFRRLYAYPKAYVRLAAESEEWDMILPTNQKIVFYQPAPHEITDLNLDNNHQNLLLSGKYSDQILGVISVIYWGFYTFSRNYAINRVNWFINGHQNDNNPIQPNDVSFCLNNAQTHLENNQIGRSIAAIGSLNQLGRTPFASKVIAFMAPDKAGVYDNRIQNGLNHPPYPQFIRNGVGAVNLHVIQQRYQAWCDYLQKVANFLNP